MPTYADDNKSEELQIIEPSVNTCDNSTPNQTENLNKNDRKTIFSKVMSELLFIYDNDSESDTDDSNIIYIIIVNDNQNKFYTKTLESARKTMWEHARYLSSKFIPEYNVYIKQPYNDPNRLEVIGCYKWFLTSYDRLLCNLHISKITKLKD